MRVHLVDGTYELFRAWFGAPSAKAEDGREVGATRGIGRQLLSLLRREEATHVAVSFDHVVESFRNQLYAGYKTGEGVEADLLGQFHLAEDMARALGLVVWPMVEFEADDGLATGAHIFGADDRVEQVRIHTPDKDLAQCVVGERIVRVDRFREKVLDAEGVVEKFGVKPASIPDWLGLVGDAADGFPGLPGWGEKSSATVLAEYEHIENIPEDPASWTVKVRGATRLATTLNEQRDDALLFRKLATLRTDVSLSERLEDLSWQGPRTAELERLCGYIGDNALIAQAEQLARNRKL